MNFGMVVLIIQSVAMDSQIVVDLYRTSYVHVHVHSQPSLFDLSEFRFPDSPVVATNTCKLFSVVA